MTINLNKQNVSKEGLLKYISDVDVYRMYTGQEIVFNTSMLSPLRNEDSPSFGYFSNDEDEICFNDYVLGGGDFVRFVELLFGLTFFEALSKIAIDFNIDKHFFVKNIESNVKPNYNPKEFKDRSQILKNKSPVNLQKKRRDWKAFDLAYWSSFGIPKSILDLYRVEPVEYIFINGFPIKVDKYAYCFIERKDGVETYKIYQPYSKEYKWRNNHNSSVWQGWSQLPVVGDAVFITKSLKDVMSIVSTTDYAAVSLQAESTSPKPIVIEELKHRFERVFVLYDNDYNAEINWGQKFGTELTSKYNLENVVINARHESKDYSDLVKKHGIEKSVEILNESILNSLPF